MWCSVTSTVGARGWTSLNGHVTGHTTNSHQDFPDVRETIVPPEFLPNVYVQTNPSCARCSEEGSTSQSAAHHGGRPVGHQSCAAGVGVAQLLRRQTPSCDTSRGWGDRKNENPLPGGNRLDITATAGVFLNGWLRLGMSKLASKKFKKSSFILWKYIFDTINLLLPRFTPYNERLFLLKPCLVSQCA